MSEVRKGTSRNTENENKRRKIFNNKNKRKIKINKQKGNKQTKMNKKKKNYLYDSLVLFLTKKLLNP